MAGGRYRTAVVYRSPVVRPGTPEAAEAGCRCRFEPNLQAGFQSAEFGSPDIAVIIAEDCPRHEVIRVEDVP
jgi:hypothetical protein